MNAAIIGAGVIGGGWAARFALMGWDVNVFDPSDGAQERFAAVYANAESSLPTPEQLSIKHKVMATIQEQCSTDAIIGSSTSGFKPTELQQNSTNPEQIIVAHPFNPVYLLPLVELVGSAATIERAAQVIKKIAMHPLHVRREIDAHIADRFLEAVWRESLWLIHDDVATTEEIDNAIRYGFGLRWAQMGLFETYRLAGGDEGMAHFIEQFGPALKWPWTKLMDVPELTPELVDQIATQSDAQSGHSSIRDLERIRDDNLVSILRALKPRRYGAGALINDTDAELISQAAEYHDGRLLTVQRVIPIDWMDYNGHMNESRYGQVFSDAADTVLRLCGADEAYVADGGSFFTVDCHIQYRNETLPGEAVRCVTDIAEMAGKKLHLSHEMRRSSDETLLASATQLLVHVDMSTRKSSLPPDHIVAALSRLRAGA